ncbi:MAG: hypothetical protein ACI3XG_09080 [Faecousia sp.]
MERIYCMNCLRQTPAYPCPLCGYDPAAAPAVNQALEQCILHGRYLTGRALEKNAIEITYKGLDLSEDRPVTIREFFPAGQAQRKTGGSLEWADRIPMSEADVLTHARQRLPEGMIRDSFSENGTVYIVCEPDRSPVRPQQPQPVKKENEWIPFLLALLLLALAALTGAALLRILGGTIV